MTKFLRTIYDTLRWLVWSVYCRSPKLQTDITTDPEIQKTTNQEINHMLFRKKEINLEHQK